MTTVGFRGDGDETDLSMVHETADDAASLRQVLLAVCNNPGEVGATVESGRTRNGW